MLFGLSLGLIVAAVVYFRSGPPQSRPLVAAPTPYLEPIPEHNDPPTSTIATLQEPAAAPEATPESRFDFYEMLPQFEVVIPEVESDARADRTDQAIDQPGLYVLQAGSFRELTDADRMQAQLALLGIESKIQRVTIDDDVFHRVRIGPLSELGQLNRVRRQLRDERIESLLMQVRN